MHLDQKQFQQARVIKLVGHPSQRTHRLTGPDYAHLAVQPDLAGATQNRPVFAAVMVQVVGKGLARFDGYPANLKSAGLFQGEVVAPGPLDGAVLSDGGVVVLGKLLYNFSDLLQAIAPGYQQSIAGIHDYQVAGTNDRHQPVFALHKGVFGLLSRTCAKVHTVLFLPRRVLLTPFVSDRRDFPAYGIDALCRSAAVTGRTRHG